MITWGRQTLASSGADTGTGGLEMVASGEVVPQYRMTPILDLLSTLARRAGGSPAIAKESGML